jgi:hypothetical protein
VYALSYSKLSDVLYMNVLRSAQRSKFYLIVSSIARIPSYFTVQFPGVTESDKENTFICTVEYVRRPSEMSFSDILFDGIDRMLKLTNSDSFMNAVTLNLCTIEIYCDGFSQSMARQRLGKHVPTRKNGRCILCGRILQLVAR